VEDEVATELVKHAFEFSHEAPDLSQLPPGGSFDVEIVRTEVRQDRASGQLIVTEVARIIRARDAGGQVIEWPPKLGMPYTSDVRGRFAADRHHE
jgi:hypothetical protein